MTVTSIDPDGVNYTDWKGEQHKITCGDVLLSMFKAEGDFFEQAIEGYCDSFARPEQFSNPSYM